MQAQRSIVLSFIGLMLALTAGCQTPMPHSPLSHAQLSPSPMARLARPLATEHGPSMRGQQDVSADRALATNMNHERSAIRLVKNESPSDAETTAGLEIEIARAEVPVTLGMNLEALEDLALENNPAIQQVSAAVVKATGIRYQVGRLPNPTIGYLGEQLGDRGTDMHGGFVAQDIVLGGKLRLNQAILDNKVQSAIWELEVQRQRVLSDVRMKFYEALATQQRLTLTNRFLEIAQSGVEVAQRRKDALVGSRPEVLQAEIQLQEIELLRQKTEIAYRAAWTSLVATAGVPDLTIHSLDGSLEMDAEPPDWDAVYLGLVETSPQISAANWRVSAARIQLDRQQVQPVPNLGIEVGMGHDNGTGGDFGRAMVGLPLPIFNRNQGNSQAAWADYCRATQEVERLRLSLKSDLAKTAREYDSAVATVTRYSQNILPRAEESLKLSEQAYATDEFEFLQVLLARRTFFESQMQFIQAQQELAQAKALLDGFLVTGGLAEPISFDMGDELRGQALSGQ